MHARRAEGWRVVRVQGVHAEELFALGGLHQVVLHLGEFTAGLAERDRAVLAPVFGPAGAAVDRGLRGCGGQDGADQPMSATTGRGRSSPGNDPDAECSRPISKASIEGRNLRERLDPGRVDNAAVRHFEPCPDPQLGQFPGGLGIESECLDLQFGKCFSRLVAAAGPDGSDKDLSESDCAGGEFIITVLQEDVRCTSVMAVGVLQVRDENTGVQDDHYGQSRRSSSRYPGP